MDTETMTRPRFVVTAVHGFAIRTGSGGSGGDARQPPPVYQILDRACCHHIVKEYPATGKPAAKRLEDAETLAAELNQEYGPWLAHP